MIEADVAPVTVPRALELAGQSQCVFLARLKGASRDIRTLRRPRLETIIT